MTSESWSPMDSEATAQRNCNARLWKLLHKAYQADKAAETGAREQAGVVRPAVSISGGGAGGGGVRDELATKEWMRRRNAQMAGDR